MKFIDEFKEKSDVWYYGTLNLAENPGPLKVRDKFAWPHVFVTPKSTAINPKNFADFSINMRFNYLKEIKKGGAFITLFKKLEFDPHYYAPIWLKITLDGIYTLSYKDGHVIGIGTLPVNDNKEFKLNFGFSKGLLWIVSKQGKQEYQLNNNFENGGYLSFSHEEDAMYYINFFEMNSSLNEIPFTQEMANEEHHTFFKNGMNYAKKQLQAYKEYVKLNPQVVTDYKCRIEIPEGLVNIGEQVIINFRYLGEDLSNGVITIESDYLGEGFKCQGIFPEWKKEAVGYSAKVVFNPEKTGNYRIIWLKDYKRFSNVFSVIDKDYIVCNLWIGGTDPRMIHHPLHKYDLPGDYHVGGEWITIFEKKPEELPGYFSYYRENKYYYGDKLFPFCNAILIMLHTPAYNMFDLPYDVQLEGIAYLKELWQLYDVGDMENFACYTENADTIRALEELGIISMNSLCVWQNYMDAGWGINHWSSPIVPYFSSHEDFRKVGNGKLVMQSMGSSTSSRNYNIYVMDGCPTLTSPSQRYTKNMSQCYAMERFYDYVECWINDKKYQDEVMFTSVCIESFFGSMDWDRANEMAIDYIVKRARIEKIVFASCVDIAKYYIKNYKYKQPEHAFYQPDTYCGLRHCALPGRIPDRMEISNDKFHTLHHYNQTLPMYFWDYTTEWKEEPWVEMSNKQFWVVPPEVMVKDECRPRMVDLEGIECNVSFETIKNGVRANVQVNSSRNINYLPVGIWRVPVVTDACINNVSVNSRFIKSVDYFTNNFNGVLVCNDIKTGINNFYAEFDGANNENIEMDFCINNRLSARYVKYTSEPHFYLWKTILDDNDFVVTIPTSNHHIYAKQCDGRMIYPDSSGLLKVKIASNWENEVVTLFTDDVDIINKLKVE